MCMWLWDQHLSPPLSLSLSLFHMQQPLPFFIFVINYDSYAIYVLPHLFFVRFPCDYHTLIQS